MSVSVEHVQDHLRGVAVGLLTPFDDELEIAHDKLAANATSLQSAGIDTFLAAANISEYHSLSGDERIDVVETSVRALPDQSCVLAGVGGSIADARSLIRAYDDVGVDAMLIMPPHHTYLHEQGLLEYYQALGESTTTPLVPYVRGYEPSVGYLAALTRLKSVAAIKYALTDPERLGAGIEAGADDVVWVDGLAEPYAVSFWAEGVEGFSAGVSNFRPEVGLELFEALSHEDWDRARELRDVCVPFQQFREQPGQDSEIVGGLSVPAVKKGLDLAGLHGGRVRPPLAELAPADERRARALYEQLDADIARMIG